MERHQQPTSPESKVQIPTLAIKGMEQIVSLAACLTKLNKIMPVKLTANMTRVNGTCMNQGVGDQRFLEYHAKKDTVMMTVDMGAETHVVCEIHKRRLHDRTTVKEGAIILDTLLEAAYRSRRWDASKSIDSQRIHALSTRWPRTVCAVYHRLRRTDGTTGRETSNIVSSTAAPQNPVRQGLVVSSCWRMLWLRWPALLRRQQRSKIRAGDELLCHIPKMTEIEPTIQPGSRAPWPH